ncbi:MAG: pirin family protein [Verrucomicrobia bacterium]|nr:pirin family protein [Verrucomicrobiota bacterium]
MKKIASLERGLTQNDWLISRHTFAFGQYYNLERLNFGTLRVFNDDFIKPGHGFGMHPHDNMEIVTIVLEGILEHKDSVGNYGIIKANDVQRMTDGKGIKHSEVNPSKDQKLHLLQIWVYPNQRNLEPGYEQKSFNPEDFKNVLYPIVGDKLGTSALFIHQEAQFFLGHLEEGITIKHVPRSKKQGDHLFVIEGKIEVGGETLKAGDSAQITGGEILELKAKEAAKVLLIEINVSTL